MAKTKQVGNRFRAFRRFTDSPSEECEPARSLNDYNLDLVLDSSSSKLVNRIAMFLLMHGKVLKVLDP